MNLLLEGDDLQALLLRAHQEGGASARIVRAEKVRRGGIFGFFAREGFEVAVEIPKDVEQGWDAAESGVDAVITSFRVRTQSALPAGPAVPADPEPVVPAGPEPMSVAERAATRAIAQQAAYLESPTSLPGDRPASELPAGASPAERLAAKRLPPDAIPAPGFRAPTQTQTQTQAQAQTPGFRSPARLPAPGPPTPARPASAPTPLVLPKVIQARLVQANVVDAMLVEAMVVEAMVLSDHREPTPFTAIDFPQLRLPEDQPCPQQADRLTVDRAFAPASLNEAGRRTDLAEVTEPFAADDLPYPGGASDAIPGPGPWFDTPTSTRPISGPTSVPTMEYSVSGDLSPSLTPAGGRPDGHRLDGNPTNDSPADDSPANGGTARATNVVPRAKPRRGGHRAVPAPRPAEPEGPAEDSTAWAYLRHDDRPEGRHDDRRPGLVVDESGEPVVAPGPGGEDAGTSTESAWQLLRRWRPGQRKRAPEDDAGWTQDAAADPAAVNPTAVDPAAVDSAAAEPPAPSPVPAELQPAELQPIELQPIELQPAAFPDLTESPVHLDDSAPAEAFAVVGTFEVSKSFEVSQDYEATETYEVTETYKVTKTFDTADPDGRPQDGQAQDGPAQDEQVPYDQTQYEQWPPALPALDDFGTWTTIEGEATPVPLIPLPAAATPFADAAVLGEVPAGDDVIRFDQLGADRKALQQLGIPAAWTEHLHAGDRFGSIVAMLGHLAEPRIREDAAVIAVVGPADVVELEAHRTALDLPAGGRPRAVTLVSGSAGADRRSAIARSKRIRPVVISVPIDGYDDPAGTRKVLASIKAEAVIVVVDATRPLAEITRWVQALEQVDAIALDGALDVDAPAAVLGLDVPVIRVDGISVDRIGWAALLCAQLASFDVP